MPTRTRTDHATSSEIVPADADPASMTPEEIEDRLAYERAQAMAPSRAELAEMARRARLPETWPDLDCFEF